MATDDSEQTVEYVELLDVPVYEENDHEIVAIEHEAIAVPDNSEDNSQIEEVEYIEAEEIDENHTIIVHEGRQYVIPTEQLQQAGNTIVLEDEDDENTETQYVETENSENIFYAEVDSEVSGQYAVLKDGKLHFREVSDDCDQSEEIQEKLRVLEESLNSYEEENDEEASETVDNEAESSPEEEDIEALSQITGKNLITGQTISLSGFLDKIRRKGIGDVPPGPSPRRGSSAKVGAAPQMPQLPQISSDYVSVPPVNRRVVVGKTADGRRLIGRILQIQKKVSPPEASPPVHKRPTQRQPRAPRRVPPPQASPQGLPSAPIPQCSVLLDENVSRTLAGLMDLESVSKSLAGRRLVVRHVQRRSMGGRALPGTRRVAYYSGRMGRGPNNDWNFFPDAPSSSRDKSSDLGGIDLCEDDNHHQVKLKIDEDGVVFSSVEEELVDEEPITLYLTVTQDEFGKKRTKVSIPQLAAGSGGNTVGNKRKNEESSVKSDSSGSGGHICQVCGKKFQTPGSLRRHASIHDPSLRPLQCLTCLARFTDESSLKKHLILHSGVRPHVCTVCGKSFAHRGDLNFHSRTHDPVKRFRCEVCGKQFHRHSNMVRHVEIHRQATETHNINEQNHSNSASGEHGDDNQEDVSTGTDNKRPPFTCDTCGCQYNFISSLTRHIVNNHMTGTVETT